MDFDTTDRKLSCLTPTVSPLPQVFSIQLCVCESYRETAAGRFSEPSINLYFYYSSSHLGQYLTFPQTASTTTSHHDVFLTLWTPVYVMTLIFQLLSQCTTACFLMISPTTSLKGSWHVLHQTSAASLSELLLLVSSDVLCSSPFVICKAWFLFFFFFPVFVHHSLRTVIITAVFSHSDISDEVCRTVCPPSVCRGRYRAVPWHCLPTFRLSVYNRRIEERRTHSLCKWLSFPRPFLSPCLILHHQMRSAIRRLNSMRLMKLT